MPIKVTTAKNYLGKGPNPYFAKSESSGCVEFDELVDIMANGRTTLTAPDIAGTLILLKEELIKLMADGKYVKTPIGAFHATACGSFQDPDQAFTPGEGNCKHGLRLHYRPPKEFQEDVELHAQFIRTERYAKNLPLINSVQGIAEGSEPSPGTYIRLQGRRMFFDHSDPIQGVFFVNGSEHRADAYAYVSGRTVVAHIPDGLEPGSYELWLRSQHNSKALKVGRAEAALSIA
jgi:hypothetical protein